LRRRDPAGQLSIACCRRFGRAQAAGRSRASFGTALHSGVIPERWPSRGRTSNRRSASALNRVRE
jgi:hypothetical protein